MIGAVPRAQWRADRASLPAKRMTLPARTVYLHHTTTEVSATPAADMRAIEAVGLARFGQFSYSYCVHPDGTVLEGCGTRVGAHTKGRNSTSFGIALIGNYEHRKVTAWQLDAVRRLIADLIAAGYLWTGTYPTGGHRDVMPTACPGANAYRLLDAMRIPWEDKTVPDDPNLPNLTGPVELHLVVSAEGKCTGYYVFSPATGELHTHGPGAPYHGRSEVPPK